MSVKAIQIPELSLRFWVTVDWFTEKVHPSTRLAPTVLSQFTSDSYFFEPFVFTRLLNFITIDRHACTFVGNFNAWKYTKYSK